MRWTDTRESFPMRISLSSPPYSPPLPLFLFSTLLHLILIRHSPSPYILLSLPPIPSAYFTPFSLIYLLLLCLSSFFPFLHSLSFSSSLHPPFFPSYFYSLLHCLSILFLLLLSLSPPPLSSSYSTLLPLIYPLFLSHFPSSSFRLLHSLSSPLPLTPLPLSPSSSFPFTPLSFPSSTSYSSLPVPSLLPAAASSAGQLHLIIVMTANRLMSSQLSLQWRNSIVSHDV